MKKTTMQHNKYRWLYGMATRATRSVYEQLQCIDNLSDTCKIMTTDLLNGQCGSGTWAVHILVYLCPARKHVSHCVTTATGLLKEL